MCFEWSRVWALEEDACRDEIQNLVSRISDIHFVSGVCENTGSVCAQSGTPLLVSNMHVLRLTGEDGISEGREILYKTGRHVEA